MTDTARITVTLDEPVAAVRRLRNDFRQDTHDHITGAVLRGALAAAWIRHHGPPSDTDEEFLDVFEGEGTFGPLHSRSSVPVPLSVKLHKYQHDPDRCRTLWWDRATGDDAQQCDHSRCGQELTASKGQPYGTIRRLQRTRVALSPEGVATDGDLFTQNSLAPETILSGWVSGPAVRALSLDGTRIDTLYFGGKRSVQGRATVDVDTTAVAEPVEQYGRTIILRLAAPGVFVDSWGLPTDEPDPEELSTVLGTPVTLEKRWTRWTEVGGWHIASGLPKPTERAVVAGSTYRLRCGEPASEEARRRLMVRGIGLRRREGFGALYPLPEPPQSFAALAGTVFPMTGYSDRLQSDLPHLRKRVDDLVRGRPDDTPFQERLAAQDTYATALRSLLRVADPAVLDHLLHRLETGK